MKYKYWPEKITVILDYWDGNCYLEWYKNEGGLPIMYLSLPIEGDGIFMTPEQLLELTQALGWLIHEVGLSQTSLEEWVKRNE